MGGGAERERRNAHHGHSTEEVDDEAAIGAASGGLAEEGHPVGRARGGERLWGAVDDEVAGVGERVAEAEDGPVRLLAPGRGGAGGRHRRQNRGGEHEEKEEPRRVGGGHCGCRQAAAASCGYAARRACAIREEAGGKKFLACVARRSPVLALYNCRQAGSCSRREGSEVVLSTTGMRCGRHCLG